MPDDRNITNPGTHVHQTRNVDGQQICYGCNQVIVEPILTFEDKRLDQSAMWLEAMTASLGGTPIDFQLMELSDRLNLDRPPYIMELMEAFGGDEPPHVQTIPWWREA